MTIVDPSPLRFAGTSSVFAVLRRDKFVIFDRDHQSNERSGFGTAGWFFRGSGGWDGVEAEFFGGWAWRCDELFDGLEDELELLVVVGVFFFEGFDFLGQEGIGIHQPAELDEGAHDGDVHLDGAG